MRHRVGFHLVAAVVLTLAGNASAQIAFDVATVKLAAPPDMAKMAAAMQSGQAPKIGPHVEGRRAEYTFMALRDLTALAYGLKPFQVIGPEWMSSTRFDLAATMPEGSSKSDAPAMLQGLLKERFNLVAHRSMEEQPVLALVAGKNGTKLKPSTVVPAAIDENAPLQPGEMKMESLDGPVRVKRNSDGSTTTNMGLKGMFVQKMDMPTRSMHIESSGVTMAGFADMLTTVMQMGGQSNRQVLDMTDMKGYFQLSLDVPLEDMMAMARASGMDMPTRPQGGGLETPSEPGGGNTVLQSIQSLGLKLEARKASVARLVIDSVDKTPTAN